MQRRAVLKGLVLAGAAGAFARPLRAIPRGEGVESRLAAIERRHGGRLGVSMLDTGSGKHVAHRGDERFLMCSTFKLLLVAVVLQRVDHGRERLDRRIVFDRDALLEWAPVTSRHVGAPGMSVAQLCEAAMTLSDNTAANMLLEGIGGPDAVTAYVRSLGDPVTRLDRIEPELNGRDGDKDTTTPAAMCRDMHRLLAGDALSRACRDRLTGWLLANRTGDDSLRAGLPAGWRVGDKTGSGRSASNDIAIVWPPGRQPLLVAAYCENTGADTAARKAVDRKSVV